jgi:hypothetical protein
MGFRVRETGEYLLTDFAVRDRFKGQINPTTLLTSEIIENLGLDPVFEGPQAVPQDHYGFSYFSGLAQVDGKWFTRYSVGPVFTDNEESTAEQQMAAYKAMKDADQAKVVRQNRDERLKSTDWVVIKHLERNENIPGAWEVYRQALRDMPAQAGFPWNVQWPVQP